MNDDDKWRYPRDDEDQQKFCRVSLAKSNGPNSLFVHPQTDSEDSIFNFQPNNFEQIEDYIHIAPDESLPSTKDLLPEDGRCRETDVDGKPIRLPLGIELSAGPGCVRQKTKDGACITKSPRPSDTLFSSATIIKSLFTFQSKEASAEKQSSSNKMLSMWHNMKYGWSSGLKTSFSKETPIYLLGKIYHSQYERSDFVLSNLEGFKKDFKSIVWLTYRNRFPPLPESELTSDCGWGCMIRSGQMIMAAALRRHFLPMGWFYEENGHKASDLIHKRLVEWFSDSPGDAYPFSLHNLILCSHRINKKAGSWFGPSCVAHMLKDALVGAKSQFSFFERFSMYVAQDGVVYIQDLLDLCNAGRCVCVKQDKEVNHNPVKNQCHSLNKAGTHKEFSQDASASLSLTQNSKSHSVSSSWKQSSPFEDEEVSCNHSLSRIPMDYFVCSNFEFYNQSQSRVFGDALSSRLTETPSQESHGKDPSDVCEVCQGWRSCLILIPVRLGRRSINPIYHNCIYSLFRHDLCIGIIGGKPKHSLYFVGFQEDNLIYLDPHLNQDFVPTDSPQFSVSSYHCSSPRKLSLTKMDPSATIGFYCHTRDHFFRLLEEKSMFAVAKDGNLSSPIFEFIDGRNHQEDGWMNEQDLNSGSLSSSLASSIDEAEELVFE